MANYVPLMRSNYFAVKSRAAFERFCKEYELHAIAMEERGAGAEELVGFLGSDERGIPRSKYDAAKEDWVDADFFGDLAKQLKPGWVAVVQEIGYEKLRYLVGVAVAVNAAGAVVAVSLNDIYKKAKRLGKQPMTPCEY
ncbi:MAG: hypothetical protein AB1411_15770 [Nitrospirota bacterium]